MPADPEDPDEVLAREQAAFPDDDEPDWAALELLEYSDSTGAEEPLSPDPALPESPATSTPTIPEGSDSPAATIPAAPADLSAPDGGQDLSASTASSDGQDPTTPGSGPGAGFAHGEMADEMAPGPLLALLAGQACRGGLDGLDDDELTGVLSAWQRLGAHAAAGLLAAVSELAARRSPGPWAARDRGSQDRGSRERRPLEHAVDEVAVALTMTRYGAGCVLSLALALDRLAGTRAALAAGLIDERRAFVIADEMAGLDDEHAAAVEALIIAKAASQTTGQLRPAVRRAVIAADPAAAKRRKDEALKDARVEASGEPSGTARLSGRDLPPAQVLTADKHLSALAKAMKKTGVPGTMDQLRAQAYLHLLAGQDAARLLLPPATGTGTTGQAPGPGRPGSRTTGTASPGTGTGSSGTGTPAGGGTPGTGTPPGGTPGGTSGTGAPGTPGGGTAGVGMAGAGVPGLGLPVLRGVVNLTMPLAAWLGWSQSPGQVPGFGTVDAEDSRALAAMLARDPATKWCITLTDTHGHAVAHGCARKGPRPPGSPSTGPDPGPGPGPGSHAEPVPGPGPRAGPGAGADPGPDSGPGPTMDNRPGPRAGPGPGPPGDPGWIPTVKITPLQTGTCTHPRETHSYQPSPTLRHIIEIRQATCSRPGCRRAATACDLDHTIPYHLGGRTCECGLAPACRHDHHLKQTPGWTLTQTQPGHMTWTTPGHRSYTTEPTSYPD